MNDRKQALPKRGFDPYMSNLVMLSATGHAVYISAVFAEAPLSSRSSGY